jgi:hypothetical protein
MVTQENGYFESWYFAYSLPGNKIGFWIITENVSVEERMRPTHREKSNMEPASWFDNFHPDYIRLEIS